MKRIAALRRAVDVAYDAFASVPRPAYMEASPYRDGDAILRELISMPLRQLPEKVIGPYAGWAMTTVGAGSDYAHFLPRILELAAFQNHWMGSEPAVIADRLKRAHWERWTAIRREAIVGVFRRAFYASLESFVGGSPDEWLCGLAGLTQPINVFLRAWERSTFPWAAEQLAEFVVDVDQQNDKLPSGFWDKIDPETRCRVGAWTRSEPVRQCLAAALENSTEENSTEFNRRRIAEAIKLLDGVAN